MTQKTASITFRVNAQTNDYLVLLAKKEGTDKSKIINQIILKHEPLQQKVQQLFHIERNLQQTQRENQQLKKQTAFFENTRFDFLFQELKGKVLEGITIQNKNDLQRYIINSFDYIQKEDEVGILPKKHQVVQPKKSNPLFLYFFVGLSFLPLIAYYLKHYFSKTQNRAKQIPKMCV